MFISKKEIYALGYGLSMGVFGRWVLELHSLQYWIFVGFCIIATMVFLAVHDWLKNVRNKPKPAALEIARRIYGSEYDKPWLDLMDHPFMLDGTTATQVYDALIYLHENHK